MSLPQSLGTDEGIPTMKSSLTNLISAARLSTMVGILLAANGIALASTSKIVVDFPVLGKGELSSDIFLYACGVDSTCNTKTQLLDYGHVTNVHRWPTGNGGPGGPPPASWAFLPITKGLAQYFEFWQQTTSGWQSCILGVTADSGLDTEATTCVGVAPVSPNNNDGVSQFSMGAAMFSNADVRPDPNPNQTNQLLDRRLSFVNDTTTETLCLQTDSTFNHSLCRGDGATQITQNASYVIDASSLENGYNAGVAQVMAYQLRFPGSWFYSGRDASGHVYATKLEWTVWPDTGEYTTGPTTIDISLVDGFNMGVRLVPDQDTVCSIADTEGGKPYFVMYRAGSTMAIFPNNDGVTLDQACPTTNQIIGNGGAHVGCYSGCTYAQITKQEIDENCCKGDYNTPDTCTLPPESPFVTDIDATSSRVYSWAYEDYRGTFTCEPSAKFTFYLTDPPGASWLGWRAPWSPFEDL